MQSQLPLCVVAFILIAGHSSAATSASVEGELTVFANEQQSVSPGYLIGNVAIGNPKVADFRVMPGRRELLVFGKLSGGTQLTLWDQKSVKRDDIIITVTTRPAAAALSGIRELLKDFPTVTVRQVSGAVMITGIVNSKDDVSAIDKIAAAVKATSVVRCVTPGDRVVITAPEFAPAPLPRVSGTASGVKAGSLDAPTEFEYEIELLEASSQFRSGSFATGVEPSGRSLSKGVVIAPIGTERELFVGGHAIAESAKGAGKTTTESSAATPPRQTGIKFTLRPTSDGKGKVTTAILIETNLPFSGATYDPSVWRRARFVFTTESGQPFGITGTDLLATPDANQQQGSKFGAATRTATKVAMIPGVGTAPGAEYVPVFGSLFGSQSYKKKATQLLVILRPRAIRPQP